MSVRAWLGRGGALAALLLLLLLPASASAPAGVTRAPAPAWVDWLPLPPANPARMRDLQDGYFDLLTDTQVRAIDRHDSNFHRKVLQVVERAGLEDAAQARVDFDPAIERLVVHRVAVWRDGQMIDRTAQAAIDILRREDSLDDNILTGERTAVIRVPDVRVGDIVDIAWTWNGFAGAWPNHYFADFTLGWTVPVGLTRVKLTLPADRPVAIRPYNGVAEPVVTRDGALVTREWRMADADPLPDTPQAPRWWTSQPGVQVSTMADWRSVAAWAQPLYARDLALPSDFAAKLDAIAARSADPAVRAIDALRLVQDSIRYTSVSIGMASFVPRAPAETVARGYGDCKDKSLLLVAALRRLGIAAWPALTDMDEGPGLATGLPGPGRFDHVITLAHIGGQDRWFDATASHQGGQLASLAPLPYGYALPLRPGQDRLEAIPDAVPARPTSAVTEVYRLDAQGLSLSVETDALGDEADALRDTLASDGIGKTERDYLKYYAAALPGLTRAVPLIVTDDRNANHLTMVEHYRLPATAPDYARTIARLEIWATNVRDLYKAPGNAARAAPIAVAWPYNRTHHIEIDAPGRELALPDLESIHGRAFDLDAVARRAGGKVLIDYHLVSRARTIAGSYAPELARQVAALNDNSYVSFDLSGRITAKLRDARDGGGTVAVIVLAILAGGWLIGRHRLRQPAPTDRYRHIPITVDRYARRR